MSISDNGSDCLKTPSKASEHKETSRNIELTSQYYFHCNNLANKMNSLSTNSNENNKININSRPNKLAFSPPKSTSILTSTTDHPLMNLGSPDSVDNYPDVIPDIAKVKLQKTDEAFKDSSLSSIEDNNLAVDTNGFPEFYQNGPQRNTSKSNLYISDNFLPNDTPLCNSTNLNSDKAVDAQQPKSLGVNRTHRKIAAKIHENDFLCYSKIDSCSPPRVSGRVLDGNADESSILKYVEERKKKRCSFSESTPKTCQDMVNADDMLSDVAKWCDTSTQLVHEEQKFVLPIQMSSYIGSQSNLESPDVLSTSTQEDHSVYQAFLDPYNGSVALRYTPNKLQQPLSQRKIAAIYIDDCCSMDSESVASLQSEDEPELQQEEALDDNALEDPVRENSVVQSEVRENSGGDNYNAAESDEQNSGSENSSPIPEYSAAEERQEERDWLKVTLPTGGHGICDMKVIDPFKRVLSHGGYEATGCAIIVLSACYLPDCARPDYNYVMDNLFLYVIWTLERLVTDEYILVYLHGAASKRRMPNFHWMHECYKLIDRRLRKNLKQLYLVHPTIWIKYLLLFTKPFISLKFYRKIVYIKNLEELMKKLPVAPIAIPDCVRQYDAVK